LLNAALMKKLLLTTLIGFTLSACGGDDENQPTPKPQEVKATCRASLSPGTVTYAIAGNTLSLSSGGQSGQLTRDVTSTGTNIYGVWNLPQQRATEAGLALTVDGSLDIERTEVTSVVTCKANGRSTMLTVSAGASVDEQAHTLSIVGSAKVEKLF
jgi:hypothetical protein